jgi:predicted Na+-dependent transporter
MIKKAIEWFANLYGIWVMGIMILCFFYPQTLEWFGGPWVRGALTLVMLAMGLTLHPSDFRKVFRLPAPIAVGFLAQYSIMPVTAWNCWACPRRWPSASFWSDAVPEARPQTWRPISRARTSPCPSCSPWSRPSWPR